MLDKTGGIVRFLFFSLRWDHSLSLSPSTHWWLTHYARPLQTVRAACRLHTYRDHCLLLHHRHARLLPCPLCHQALCVSRPVPERLCRPNAPPCTCAVPVRRVGRSSGEHLVPCRKDEEGRGGRVAASCCHLGLVQEPDHSRKMNFLFFNIDTDANIWVDFSRPPYYFPYTTPAICLYAQPHGLYHPIIPNTFRQDLSQPLPSSSSETLEPTFTSCIRRSELLCPSTSRFKGIRPDSGIQTRYARRVRQRPTWRGSSTCAQPSSWESPHHDHHGA